MAGKDKDNGNPECFFSEALNNEVPAEVSVDFSVERYSVKEIIQQANNKAYMDIIKVYSDNEHQRIKRQKYLLAAVIFLTTLQLIFLNVIIFITVLKSFEMDDLDGMAGLFSILKYYIGVTAAELIGMIYLITRETFSSNHVKTMEKLISETFAKQKDSSQ